MEERQEVYVILDRSSIGRREVELMQEAHELGRVTVGVVGGDPERIAAVSHLQHAEKVVAQASEDPRENLRHQRPSYVVCGPVWRQKSMREKTIAALAEWGGHLVEVDVALRKSLPEVRRPRLAQILRAEPIVRVMEAHSGLTGLVVEHAFGEGGRHFHGIWVSSLCDSTAKGKPDIELVDVTSRMRTVQEILEVTTLPIVLDGDTGGLPEHFGYLVRTLERKGVSAIIIEDKVGLKKNSLFGTGAAQTQDSVEGFCHKIRYGKDSLVTEDFMIVARIESLILKQGLDDALIRARAYMDAGADGIMIHSRETSPDEVYQFCEAYRKLETRVPLVVVPSTYNKVTEDELKERGVNMVIYANHLIRSAYPAMAKVAKTILEYGRAFEAEDMCMPISEILTLIPEDSRVRRSVLEG